MPTGLTHPPQLPPPQIPPRKLWTRAECSAFQASRLFERERLELIGGELISKIGKNRPHVNAAMYMLFWLADIFGKTFVNVEAPIDVHPDDNSTSEPEPDLIVLNQEYSVFTSTNPEPRDIRLLIEISDSTLSYHLNVKAILYARAAISEYWVLDLNGRCLIVHRDPKGDSYASVAVYAAHECVAPLAAPHAAFRISQVLAM